MRFGELVTLVGGNKIYLNGEGSPALLSPSVPKVAIVGTRAPTQYGRGVIEEWVKIFHKNGIGLVTGAASGVDIHATRVYRMLNKTSENKMPIVQVLPSPLDSYELLPTKKDLELIFNEPENSAVVSQFMAGAPIEKWMFVRRNEVIAGLSNAVLVIEAAGVSGSFHTVRYANEFGVPCFAVPGRRYDHYSVGCNLLIKKGEATLADEPTAIIDAILKGKIHE